MPNFIYYQVKGGEERWTVGPASQVERIRDEFNPMFITALSVAKMPEELEYDEKLKLAYYGPLYFDWDSEDGAHVIEKVNEMLDNLEELGLDLHACRLYATGGRGYHLEIPPYLFIDKDPSNRGVVMLPAIYREMALDLAVDTLDLTIYSTGRGRMWRQPNVERQNGRYKVPITVDEMRSMTVERCEELTSKPRSLEAPTKAELCLKLNIKYEEAKQKVEALMKRRGKFKADPKAKEKANGLSVEMMLAGLGIKEGSHFQQIATQLAIVAHTAGWSESDLVEKAQGLVNSHQSDGNRYNSPEKRNNELRRMWRYMYDNVCYEFSIGALKALMSHSAPDLDNIPTTREELEQTIKEEAAAEAESEDQEIDEYADVAAGISLTKYGVYMQTATEGKKRICAVSFETSAVLFSTESGQIVAFEAEVLVNGRPSGRQTLELDVFSGLVQFNRFVARYGHSFQGTDLQVRTVMMRFVEQAKKKGESLYIVKREGLDLVNIQHHENELYRKPFLVWADHHQVVLQKEIAESGLNLVFTGFPDPQGEFKTDLSQAPVLKEWIEEPGNKEKLRDVLQAAMTCQKSELIGKYIGWYVACFWKPLFQAAYGKFPLLHVNGAAGAGKCMGFNTPVIMADGTTKMVQDVQVGDQLLGPDGGVRNVLSLARGRELMYRVTPVKGDSYVVNASHILSLKRSDRSCRLSDGTQVTAADDVVNVNVEVYAHSSAAARKALKGWRSDAVEFHREAEDLPLDPYWLGVWLGDGKHDLPQITKPADTNMVRWWIAHAEQHGHLVSRHEYDDRCPSWAVRSKDGRWDAQGNQFTQRLQALGLLGNKHIPAAYKFAPMEDRLRLLAGLIDSDGSLDKAGYDWVSKDKSLAEDFAFLCRSVGLAAYVKECTKGIQSTDFVGTYWRVSVSGDCDKIPCLDKKAPPRKQAKRVTVTGISVEPIGVDNYYGFQIDGDHLFLLGDFTVTHNTDMTKSFSCFFYHQREPYSTSPTSTVFSITQQISSTSSIPFVLDEYKPHALQGDMVNKLRAIFRDSYNQTMMARGGGTRENDDYRQLQRTQLSAPVVFIAEAAESEPAVMERVVLATVVPPPASMKNTWRARFQLFRQNRELLGILGQYLAAKVVQSYSVDRLRTEFNDLYEEAANTYMLNADDIERMKAGDLDEELSLKANAKERSVYNHTVAKFGFQQFRSLINQLLGPVLDDLMGELESGLYARMSDLQASTTPEIVRVLETMSRMTYATEDTRPDALRENYEYAIAGDTLELDAYSAYTRYRIFMRQAALQPLFPDVYPFLQAMKDLEAYKSTATGDHLKRPQVIVLSINALTRAGVPPFKGGK